MSARYNTPMTEFTNYVKADPEAPGPRITPAALITAEARDHVREFWKLPDAQVGMWILMEPNGSGFLMTDSNFKAKYTPMHKEVPVAVMGTQFAFKKYSAAIPETSERRTAWATEVRDIWLEHVQRRWPGSNPSVGDYILLNSDGTLDVMSPDEFAEAFPNPQITD